MQSAYVNIGRAVLSTSGGICHALHGASIIVEDGRIAAYGESLSLSDCDEVLDCGGRLVTPGFVDAHTHLIFGGDRSNEFEMRCGGATYEQIAAQGGGIASTVERTRAASLEELVTAGLERLRWAISTGTTALECKTGYGLDELSELKMLFAINEVAKRSAIRIVPTLLAMHAVPPEFAGRRPEYSKWVCTDLLPKAKEAGAQFVDAFIEFGYFESSDALELAASAKFHGLGLRLHVDQLTEGGGAALAAKLGAVTADHLEQTGVDGIRAMKEAGTIPVLLPASVFALGKQRYPDARRMIDEGLKVVLATDFNPGSSPTLSMPFVMSLACTQMGMSPAESLAATTSNAAEALGISANHGSIEVGKQANFLIWNLEHEREIPYWIAAPTVHQTVISGKARLAT